jgi:hypothetical protein
LIALASTRLARHDARESKGGAAMTGIWRWLLALFGSPARRAEDEARDPQRIHAIDAAAQNAAGAAAAGIPSQPPFG